PARHHSSVSNFSIFTSWSLSYAVAAKFAVDAFYVPPGQQLTEEGVIMQLEIDPEFTVKSPNNILSEQEVFVIGPIQATGVEEVKRSDFNIPPATIISYRDLQALLNAIPYGEKWPAMPSATPCLFVAEKWGDLLINQSGIQAFLVAGGAETPLLNGGVNSWSTDAYGIICFNLGRPLAANERIKVVAPHQNRSYEGSSTAKYPILYLNNNPHNIVVRHHAPTFWDKENYPVPDGLNKEFELGALVEISPEDVYGNDLDVDPQDKSKIIENLDRVELLLDGVVVPLWRNIAASRQVDPIENGFYTTWTPTENRTYVFKPRAYLKDGTVLEDHKPLNIHVGSAGGSVPSSRSLLGSAPGHPGREKLIEVYPNPVGEAFTLTYELPQADEVSVLLQAVNGSRAKLLLTGQQGAGRHQLTVPSGGLAAGVYLLIVRGRHGYEQRQKLLRLP
ncbi:hypothetical protein IC235_10265, partial [Hymenobacter sp. BT664]